MEYKTGFRYLICYLNMFSDLSCREIAVYRTFWLQKICLCLLVTMCPLATTERNRTAVTNCFENFIQEFLNLKNTSMRNEKVRYVALVINCQLTNKTSGNKTAKPENHY